MANLAESGDGIDLVTLVGELDRRKELNAVGDVAYVSSLICGLPDRPSISSYVSMVKQSAQVRALRRAAELAISRC